MKAHSKIFRILLIAPALSLLTACTDTMFEDGDSAPALVPVGEEGTLFLAPGISLPEGEGNHDMAYSEATSTSHQSVRKRATYFDGAKMGVYFKWETDDKVGIFPIQGNQAELQGNADQQLFNCTSVADETAEGNSSAHFRPENENFAWTEGYSYRAYYPFNPSATDATQVPLSYTGQKQTAMVDMVSYYDNEKTKNFQPYYDSEVKASAHLSQYSYLKSEDSSLSDGKMQFQMNHLGGVVRFFLSLPKSTPINVSEVRLVATKPVFAESATFNMIDGTTQAGSLSNSITLATEGISFSGETTYDYYYLVAYAMAYPVALTSDDVLGTTGKIYIYVRGKNNIDEDLYYRSGAITKKDISAGALTQFSVKPNEKDEPIEMQPISVQEWTEGITFSNGEEGTGTGNW